ncbi:hypothetical protein SAMN05192549_12221 [Duganella sacchari]|uniref:Uncharacterized protein n=1 Tax=Duganella sacchari TaxID=551987 RepID=A0A1M7RE81_9BURK|nr:hypothetical protein [Duganella sacchari]SHN44449.1 hypothetical protein SAMN05192549_12221 [Duganella sacchari]
MTDHSYFFDKEIPYILMSPAEAIFLIAGMVLAAATVLVFTEVKLVWLSLGFSAFSILGTLLLCRERIHELRKLAKKEEEEKKKKKAEDKEKKGPSEYAIKVALLKRNAEVYAAFSMVGLVISQLKSSCELDKMVTHASCGQSLYQALTFASGYILLMLFATLAISIKVAITTFEYEKLLVKPSGAPTDNASLPQPSSSSSSSER